MDSRRAVPLAVLAALAALAGGACRTEPAPPPAPPPPPERSLRVTATAYNSTVAQTDAAPRDAAWGHRLRPGMRAIAVSADLVDLGLAPGTPVAIEGLPGTWVVLDRLPSDRRRAIDVYMGEDIPAAKRFGRRTVRIRWRDATPAALVR